MVGAKYPDEPALFELNTIVVPQWSCRTIQENSKISTTAVHSPIVVYFGIM